MANNILEKNINALKQRDTELANRILCHIPTEVPQIVKENNFYNLIYKNEHLHNLQNPLGEAKEIFLQAENNPAAIHFIFGLGLGYLFQVGSANSQGTVILYEPDLNILKTSFMLVDFSADILKKNVFITDNLDKACEYIHQKSNTKNTPLLLSTIGYQKLAGEKFNELINYLQRIVGMFSLDLRYTQERFFPLLNDIIDNFNHLLKEPPISSIKDCYKGKTAVVVSAGPSLDRDIETIKKYRENIILFVVGTALKTLIKNDITPDFLAIIESYDSSKQLDGVDVKNINFITEPFSNFNTRNFEFKQKFSHISSNFPVNKFWSDLIEEDTSEYLSKGTVSYTALNCARILGCSKIILVGQDLAYVEGQCYSKDSAYKDLECTKIDGKWQIQAKNFDEFANAISNSPDIGERKAAARRRLDNLNKSLYYVKGINGDNIPTESVYAAFIEPLREFTQMYKGIRYINASLIGAQIDGFENISLEDALKDSVKIENRELNVAYQYNVPKLREKLRINIDNLKHILIKTEEGKHLIKSFNNDLKRTRDVSTEILKKLKNIILHFQKLSEAQKDTLFDFITAEERINIEYELKMTRDLNINALNNLVEKLNLYYIKGEEKINVITDKLKKKIEELQ